MLFRSAAAKAQCDRLKEVRATRDQARVAKALADLKRCAEGSENTMPYILEAVRAYATVGEICDAFRGVFGTYTEDGSW